MSPHATKLRLLAERAARDHEVASEAELAARRKMEQAQMEYGAQLQKEGLCIVCLESEADGSHHGKCYVAIG